VLDPCRATGDAQCNGHTEAYGRRKILRLSMPHRAIFSAACECSNEY